MALDQAVVDRIVELRREGKKQVEIAAELGVGQSTVCNHLKAAALRGELGTRPVLDGFEITKITTKEDDGSYVTQKPEKDEELVLPEGHVLERASIKVGDSWYKTRRVEGMLSQEDVIEVFSAFRGTSPKVWRPSVANDDLITVYPTSDLHIGMLAWGKETGTPWDLKIAHDTVFNSMVELVECAPPSRTAILLDMGDYTHANDQTNATPASGHQLDVDGRFQKIGKEALRLRREMIECALMKHEHVIYRGLPGNHDPEVARMITLALSLFFENNPDVTVDDDPSEFWFYQHGTVMLCANHGHKVKPDRLPGVMASYRPEMWGHTKVRQAFSGHIHHTKAGEDMGARWETLRTAAPRDAYSHSHGYSAGRELLALTYHRERGLRSRQVVEIL